MKVLFAVNNESISESITKKYQQEYKEIISVKNVYYFNAIIKELQRDKTYDRIVISEDLQPFSSNNYDQIDKFIFEKLDTISDEATNQEGNDIPIILICADRREKSEQMLVKLFGIGVYNALIGKDRSITAVCQLLNRPRGKKEAKAYYHIDPDDVDYKVENEGDVSEVEIQNILNHYKRLGRNEEQYVESFDHIASQYTDAQLRLIAKFLPLNVKAVLEANSPKYQEVVAFGIPSKPAEKYNQYNKKEKVKKESLHENMEDLEIIRQNLNKNIVTEPVVIPSAINTSTVKRIQEEKSTNDTPIKSAVEVEHEENFNSNAISSNNMAMEVENNEDNNMVAQEEPQPKRRGRPKKVKVEEETEPVVKRGRGRPKKQETIEQRDASIQGQITIMPNAEEETAPVNLFELGDEESQDTNNNEDNIVLPGLDNEFLFAQENEPEYTFESQNSVKQEEIPQPKPINEPKINVASPITTSSYNEYNTASIISKDKKIVAFVGTSKNGTSFLVNNVAELLSQKGINTAILDLTRNKNAYYIYTENEEKLRNIAYNCIDNLKNGNATGIQVHKNLTVYTTLPGEEQEATNYANILETLARNYSLVILDCDFETDYNYFAQAHELYLVQSPDILTIQPLTAFLRNLKSRNVLAPEKIRIVLNKMVRLKSVTERTIIGGIAYYNDPAMSFMTELFNKDTVKYCVIPFEEQTYSKYLDGIINCKITLNGYSRTFISTLETLSNMVYPLIGNNTRNTSYNPQNSFTPSMNDTLNKMKNNY